MRVAYICADPGVPVFGQKGCSIHVQEITRAFLAKGFRVTLFATRFDGDVPADLKSIKVFPLPPVPKGDLEAREKAALEANAELSRALQESGPFDLVYERYSLWSYAGMLCASSCTIPGILEVNAPLIDEQARHRGLSNRDVAYRVAETAFGAATTLVAVSRDVAAYLETFRVTKGRVCVVPNGVRPERFHRPTDRHPKNREDAFTIGFVGTLKPWHGVDVLVDAFKRFHKDHPAAQLLIVGDGPERPRLEDTIHSQNLSNAVRMVGAVPPDAIPEHLALMDVAVAPYPALDSFYFSPLKVLEYMAAGVPVVASRIGQLCEILQHGENGLLCDPGDAGALATALTELFDDAGKRRRLAEHAQQTVKKFYTWDTALHRILHAAGVNASLHAH